LCPTRVPPEFYHVDLGSPSTTSSSSHKEAANRLNPLNPTTIGNTTSYSFSQLLYLEGERKSPTAECPQQANATTFRGVYTATELKHRRRIYRYGLSICSSFIAMPTNLGAYRRGIPRTRETVRPPVRSYQALYSLGIWFWQPNQGLFTQKQPTGGNLHQSGSRTETLSHGPSASVSLDFEFVEQSQSALRRKSPRRESTSTTLLTRYVNSISLRTFH
jgi:hypothetical protein